MKEFQVIRYVSRWRYLIVLCMLLGGVLFYKVFNQRQQYTAYAVISYTNEEAKNGKTPSGADIDVTRIYSSNVVANAIDNLGTDVGVDYVRSRITVEPVISEEEQIRKDALLGEGEEYLNTPTDYYISFTVGSDRSQEFAKNVLSAVLSSYFTYYGERYVAQTIKPNNVENITDGKFDYIESVDIMKQSVEQILVYLNGNEETYRSSATGYSFYDLASLYRFIRDVNIDRLYVDILAGKITKDKNVLIEKYNSSISSLNLELSKNEEQSVELLSIMGQYNPKIMEAQDYSTASTTDESSNSIILQDIYERTDSDGNPVYSENTYDTLMNKYVSYNLEKFRLEKEIEDQQYILDVFTNGTVQGYAISEENLKERINSLADELNSLYKIVNQTGQEYNNYLVGKNIAITSSVSANAQMNMKIFLAIALVLFFGIGCLGAIVIGRVGDIVEYSLYTDKKTRLPSRLKCDEVIAGIQKQGSLDLLTCVILNVKNLKEINTKYGHATGDMILQEFGNILNALSKEYGFIGYNGGNQFLCLLNGCSSDKARFMLESLEMSLKQLSRENPEYAIELTAKILESKQSGIYQINRLISSTFEQEEQVIC